MTILYAKQKALTIQKAPLILKELNKLIDSTTKEISLSFIPPGEQKQKIDHSELTQSQLKKWGLKYHELHFGKPDADFYIDDKANDIFGWFSS